MKKEVIQIEDSLGIKFSEKEVEMYGIVLGDKIELEDMIVQERK